MSLRTGPAGLHSLPFRLSNLFVSTPSQTIAPLSQLRPLHTTVRQKPVPKPTPFVPNTKTFLTLIGRKMSRYASKLESWNDLFQISSAELRDVVGMVSAKERRYLLRWLERFRQGQYGIGGDLKHVVGGAAELKVLAIPKSRFPGERKPGKRDPDGNVNASKAASPTLGEGLRFAILNPTPRTDLKNIDMAKVEVKKFQGIKLHNNYMIRAPYIELLKAGDGFVHGMVAKLGVHEGMWEDKLGRKVDGGERNRDEVRAKRKAAARKARQEAAAAADA